MNILQEGEEEEEEKPRSEAYRVGVTGKTVYMGR